MKKGVLLSMLLIIFAMIVIVNTPLASVLTDPIDISSQTGDAPDKSPLRSSAPIPSSHTLLLIGSGLIGLIIYRKRFKDKK